MSVFHKFLIKRIYFTIALSAISLSLSAQNLSNDSLNFVNARWNTQKFKGGVKVKTVHFKACEIFNGNQHISIIEISPKNKYKFDLAYQAKALITLDSVIKKNKAFAGINGTFFDTKNGGVPGTPLRKKICTTPPTALLPYKAEAGPLTISIRSIMSTGMLSKIGVPSVAEP